MALKQVIHSAVKGGFLLFLLTLTACQGMERMVKPEDRISLQEGGPHSGNWESKTMSLDYQYNKQSDEIKLSVRPTVKTKASYAGFKVWVLFVDSQGKIIEEKSIDSGQNTFKIPPETTELSFRTFLEPNVYKPKISR
ncbi:MAG: hypothetical protein P8130_15530 [Deltaproteobacteria bacterium]